jgi:hypothetical protein
MADGYVLRLESAEAGGEAIGFVPEDRQLLEVMKRRGETKVRVAPKDEDDTEGHALGTTVNVRAILDDDDTEGHAISLHFPTRKEADAFRRRLLAAGALTGAIAIGTVGAVGLANLPAGEGAAGSGQTAVTQAGPMDVHEAPAFGIGAASGAAGEGMDWTQPERPVQAAVGPGTQAGPMDVHEAPAFQSDQGSSSSGERDVRTEWARTHAAGADDGADDADLAGRGIRPE